MRHQRWTGARPHRKLTASVALVGIAALSLFVFFVALDTSASSTTAGSSARSTHTGVSQSVRRQPVRLSAVPVTTPAPTPSVTTPSVSTTSSLPAAPVAAAPVTTPTLAALVQQVEAAGIEPGVGWSWSVGDTAACGAIAGSGSATGCTSWDSGVIRTVFNGQPAIALVAHELANAETEADAVPALLQQVAAVAAGSSWSTTDAVASCLVVHFLGIQDDAAGPWQCPPMLATQVAAHIHDTVTTTQTTAVCGTASGTVSTLTFTAGSGTLTVTSPVSGVPSQTAPAGTPVTVSGVGTFTAVDHGGTVAESGTCSA